MNNEDYILEVRPVAMSLLVIATGDARKIPEAVNIVNNAALRYCIELLGNFRNLARTTKHDLSLGGWLDRSEESGDFFIYCGRLLDAVDRRVRGRHSKFDPACEDEPSTYDHAAYLALGQTLCRIGGVVKAKFPTTKQCLSKIEQEKPRVLQELFLTNYLGNVLQDYFDASRVRGKFASLQPETEGRLRTEDAVALSKAVFARVPNGDGPVDLVALQSELRDLIGRVWDAEKALDD